MPDFDKQSPPQWIELAGGANARDLGGLPAGQGRRTRTGTLIRSANLQHLTEDDLALLVVELGVRTVIDLRTDVEVEAEGPGPLSTIADVTIHHLSLFPDAASGTGGGVGDAASGTGGGVEDAVSEIRRPVPRSAPDSSGQPDVGTDPEPDSLLLPWHGRGASPERTGNRTADLYLTYLDQRPDSVVGALRAIAEADGAAIVHCAAGKDRTGVVVAIALSLVGVQRAAIAADYEATESQIAAVFALLARTATYRNEVADPASVPAPKAEVIEAVLGQLSANTGGIEGWLREHGWTEQDTARLRAKLVE
ncbi:tyrosine-protein phosphatase [Jatrophihabitans telluris]|uniref:Tyrosine-protein phosphatase n=1 Tax=Jatrophihabitans telluris TaxID=2038343 RepID=A0ABY4QZT2_9ACTN|nr:tyrosine-protein phosphatase [Jatrophihabitans telluris]UQX88381.1 tyrosine-protein phosphatase [Jatrophihabitans telluris]